MSSSTEKNLKSIPESNINQLPFANQHHQPPPHHKKSKKMTNSSKQVTTIVIRFFCIPQCPQDGIPAPTIRHAPQVRMLTRVAGNTGHWRPNHLRHPDQAPHDPYIVHPESLLPVKPTETPASEMGGWYCTTTGMILISEKCVYIETATWPWSRSGALVTCNSIHKFPQETNQFAKKSLFSVKNLDV